MSILSARTKAGLTQADIARELNVTAAAVSTWESGRSLPRAERLRDIARICHCTVDELLLSEPPNGE